MHQMWSQFVREHLQLTTARLKNKNKGIEISCQLLEVYLTGN